MYYAEQIAWTPTVWFAFLALVGVTTEYLVLVNPMKNKGAKRLLFLLSISVLLTGLTLARIYIGDWDFRFEVLSGMFAFLGVATLYLGWNIWSDQREGVRQYRAKQAHPSNYTPKD